MKDSKDKFKNIKAKTAAIVGAALAAISAKDGQAAELLNNSHADEDMFYIVSTNLVKPMPVLKLNLGSPEDSQFVASHTSHRSHRSHSSHYSHRSGAMFA